MICAFSIELEDISLTVYDFQRPRRNSQGSIKEMGTQHKILDKILFCMKRHSRIGVVLSIGVFTQVFGLVSIASTVMLLIKIGFPLQGVLLLLLSVRIDRNETYL